MKDVTYGFPFVIVCTRVLALLLEMYVSEILMSCNGT